MLFVLFEFASPRIFMIVACNCLSSGMLLSPKMTPSTYKHVQASLISDKLCWIFLLATSKMDCNCCFQDELWLNKQCSCKSIFFIRFGSLSYNQLKWIVLQSSSLTCTFRRAFLLQGYGWKLIFNENILQKFLKYLSSFVAFI